MEQPEISRNQLAEWMGRLAAAQSAHYFLSERYNIGRTLVGVPLVTLSAIVSAFTFFESTSELADSTVKYAALAVACLAAIQAFARPAERYEHHRSKAAKYGSLKRRVEAHIFVSRADTIDPEFVFRLIDDWNAVAEDARVAGIKTIQRFEGKYSEQSSQ